MPSNVQNGTFTSCEGELQDVVGVYSVNGVSKYLDSFRLFFLVYYHGLYSNFFLFFYLASTWSMPQTLNGPPPYTPRVPASSNCQTFHSTDLFAAAPTVSFFLSICIYPHSNSLPSLSFRAREQLRPLVLINQLVQALALEAVLNQQAQVHNLQLSVR